MEGVNVEEVKFHVISSLEEGSELGPAMPRLEDRHSDILQLAAVTIHGGQEVPLGEFLPVHPRAGYLPSLGPTDEDVTCDGGERMVLSVLIHLVTKLDGNVALRNVRRRHSVLKLLSDSRIGFLLMNE